MKRFLSLHRGWQLEVALGAAWLALRKSRLIKLCPGGPLHKGGDAPGGVKLGSVKMNFEDADAFVGTVTATRPAARGQSDLSVGQ